MPQPDPDRPVALIFADSAGYAAIPQQDRILAGSQTIVGPRIIDSKARREALTLLNDADKVRREQKAGWAKLRAARDELQVYADSVAADRADITEDLAQELLRKITELETRLAKIEANQEDNQLPPPPGMATDATTGEDDGDLQDINPPVHSADEEFPEPPGGSMAEPMPVPINTGPVDPVSMDG